jgi:UDP:flavonoid glycosyltransferase YjiC (YdhE family)
LYVFIASSKAHVDFVEIQKLQHPHKRPHKQSDTWWACRYAAISTICSTYDSLLLALEEMCKSSVHSKAVEAKGLLHQVQSFSFIVSLIMLCKIMSCKKQVPDQLQSSKINLFHASELVSATKTTLQSFRTDEYWNKVYSYATEVANLHSVSVELPTTRKRKKTC